MMISSLLAGKLKMPLLQSGTDIFYNIIQEMMC